MARGSQYAREEVRAEFNPGAPLILHRAADSCAMIPESSDVTERKDCDSATQKGTKTGLVKPRTLASHTADNSQRLVCPLAPPLYGKHSGRHGS